MNITKEFIQQYKVEKSELEKKAYVICERVGKIIELICSLNNVEKPYSTWFEGAGEGEVGFPVFAGMNLPYEGDWYKDEKIIRASLATRAYDYSTQIPVEFLSMDDGDIAARVQAQIEDDKTYNAMKAGNVESFHALMKRMEPVIREARELGFSVQDVQDAARSKAMDY